MDNQLTVNYQLERMQAAVERFGHPERKYKVIHVGGTSGKGSTCAMIASILQAAGYNVGLFTSPALVTETERITVNGKPIRKLVPPVDVNLTEFEQYTLAALSYFADRQVDYAVIEVGIGGKFDATNIVQPTVAIVTDIGLDHMDILGKTKQIIARDKQDIIKPGCIGLTGSTFIKRGTYIDLSKFKLKQADLTGSVFDYKHLKDVQLNWVGHYQIRNAILAIEAVQRLGIGSAAIRYGLKTVQSRGRFEVVNRKPLIILDGAHNPQKMSAFTHSLKQLVPLKDKTVICLCSIKSTKDLINTLKPLLSLVDEIILTTFPNSYSLTQLEKAVKKLDKTIKIKKLTDSTAAFKYFKKKLTKQDVGIVTGSLYLIGKILPLL
ncbi:MAG: folylpolyglutamate synthase/dihydrofolate synthase family protein [Patescibacteria group bacterium]|jgi:dihydrofolate synthase/folylpolyglutamate synthase